MKKRRNVFRHVLQEEKARKPLTRRAVLLRLREIYEVIDPKRFIELTANDVEVIDYNFALAQLYDNISRRGEVNAIGFEVDVGGEDYQDEEDE